MTDTPANPSPSPGAPVPPGPTPASRKKASLGKKLFRLFAVLFVLFIVALLVLFLNINTLVKMGVVRGGKYATDQTTQLDAANLSLAGGALTLTSLDINNDLKGYTQPKFISMKDCQVTVESSSVFTHTVVIDSIAIQGLEITLEQNGTKNNLSEIMDIVNKKTAATGDSANAPPGKELKITKLTLVGTKVHVRSGAPLNVNLDLDLPPLTIEDPTNPDGRPMKIADLVGTILLHLSQQIVENPQIPGGIKDAMKNVTALVGNLKGQLDKGVKDFGNIGKSAEDAVKNMDTKGLQDAGKKIGDLFNQNKNPPK